MSTDPLTWGTKVAESFKDIRDYTGSLDEYPFLEPEVFIRASKFEEYRRPIYLCDEVIERRGSEIIVYSKRTTKEVWVSIDEDNQLHRVEDVSFGTKITNEYVIPREEYYVEVYDLITHKVKKFKAEYQSETEIIDDFLSDILYRDFYETEPEVDFEYPNYPIED